MKPYEIKLDYERKLIFTEKQFKAARKAFEKAVDRAGGHLIITEAEFYAASYPQRLIYMPIFKNFPRGA